MATLSKKELAIAYKISSRTLSRWLKKLKLDTGHRNILTNSELETLFKEYKNPIQ